MHYDLFIPAPPFQPVRRGAGAPRRPAVVLLHSSGASARQWDALAASLRPGFDVFAIDLQGHGGQEPWPPGRPLTLQDEIELVLPLLERLRGAHVVGHSYGAAVALHLAAARPALVHSLALFEPVAFSLLADHDLQGHAVHEVVELASALHELVSAGQAAAAAERFVGYWSGAPAWRQMGIWQQRALTRRMPLIVQHFDALFAAALPPDLAQRLEMPLLCLSGGSSTAAARRIAELLCGLLPKAWHMSLPELGHLAPLTHAAEVNAHLLHFLQGAAGAQGALGLPARAAQ